jgi:AcrR family transcriptional regulator
LAAALKPRKKPTQDRSAATVEAILEAAIRILGRDGWARFTTTRVAARAGVSVGSLYQYFPNREAIVAAVVRDRTRRLQQAVMAVDLSGADRQAAALRSMDAFLEEKRRNFAVSLAVREALPDVQGRQAILEETRAFVPALQAKLAPVLGAPPDAARLAMALAAVEGAIWEALAQDPNLLLRPTAAESLARVFLAALAE